MADLAVGVAAKGQDSLQHLQGHFEDQEQRAVASRFEKLERRVDRLVASSGLADLRGGGVERVQAQMCDEQEVRVLARAGREAEGHGRWLLPEGPPARPAEPEDPHELEAIEFEDAILRGQGRARTERRWGDVLEGVAKPGMSLWQKVGDSGQGHQASSHDGLEGLDPAQTKDIFRVSLFGDGPPGVRDYLLVWQPLRILKAAKPVAAEQKEYLEDGEIELTICGPTM